MSKLITSLIVGCLLIAANQNLQGQVVAKQGKDLEVPIESVGDWGTVYEMTVTPAAEATPAFKHRLTTPLHETIPGNAVTHYLRSFGENSLGGWERAEKEFGFDEFHSWNTLETPASEIPLEDLKTASSYFDRYVDNHLRRATICREADWGLAIEDLRGLDMVRFLLPSAQETRQIARTLTLRNRLAVMEGRHADSIENIRMCYQLGQDVNEYGFLVTGLIAAAEVGMANECMIDLISSPDSPNMYWALAELPRPILSFRKALRIESSWPQRFFPELEDVETAEYSSKEWKRRLTKVIDDMTAVRSMTSSPTGEAEASNSFQSQLLGAAAGLAGYTSAKQRLLDSGMDPERVKAMAVAQVLLIDLKRDCEYFANEFEKNLYVPYKNRKAFSDRANDLVEKYPTRFGAIFVGMISPAIEQVQAAERRVQVGIDALMVIESIRHHVASKGELPKSLDELELPIRTNAMTGKSFIYQTDGEKAILDVKINYYSKRFAISIAKQKAASKK